MAEKAFDGDVPGAVLDAIAAAQASRLEIDPSDPSHVALYMFEYGSVVEHREGYFAVTDKFDENIFTELLLHPPTACTLRPGYEESLKEQLKTRLAIPEEKEAIIERLRQRRETMEAIWHTIAPTEEENP